MLAKKELANAEINSRNERLCFRMTLFIFIKQYYTYKIGYKTYFYYC